jgi:starch synthase
MRVAYATAELAPVAAVGGLAAAAAGLTSELRGRGVEVEVLLPDYAGVELADEEVTDLPVPEWASPARVRRGVHAAAGPLSLVQVPGIERPHPYVSGSGEGWHDNDRRFLAFSAAVAAVASRTRPDVLHLNDWHTAAAPAFLDVPVPTVLSVHNLAYQGWAPGGWLSQLRHHAHAYDRHGELNPLAGGIALADAVVVVSPTYREEVLRPEHGCGLDELLRARGDVVVGILNGIDAVEWDPATDPHLPRRFGPDDLAGKVAATASARQRLGLPESPRPLAVAVTRLVHQKGIDLLLPLVPFLDGLPAQVAVLGSGEPWLVGALRDAAAARPGTVAFVEAYDPALSHLLIGGGDLLVMPSRFEPCGLTQMQAMRYGTLPVVTDVGGLHDTVVDLDADPAEGTGWTAPAPDPLALLDALHRAVRGWSRPAERTAAQRRGMEADWSWNAPAARHLELYERLA